MSESTCPYYRAKGRHLFVGHRNGACCHRCGIEQKEPTARAGSVDTHTDTPGEDTRD